MIQFFKNNIEPRKKLRTAEIIVLGIERTGRGFRLAVYGLFSFSLKIHFKGRQLPAERRFFKISFALVIRATGFWQPAGQKIFPFTPYTTAF